MANHDIVYLTDNDFEAKIATGVVLVDFYADWCGPCRMIAPIIEDLARDFKGRAVVAKVDVDQAQNVSSKYNVTSIPTVILFVNGKEDKRVVGVRDKKAFEALLEGSLV